MGGLTFTADSKQPCAARVCSVEVKGGGVRNAAEAGKVRCYPCSCGVSTADALELGVACNLGCVDVVLAGANLSVVS